MPRDKITLTREELYEKVWTIPMQKLAKEFGYSDTGFAKLCRRHKIPVPGRGYWARLLARQELSRTSLPKNDDARLDTIEIHPKGRSQMEGNSMEEKQPIPKIDVADDHPITHPLALQVERSILRSTDEKGVLLPRKERVVPIRVSQEALPCALRILDAILTAIEGAGHTLSWSKPYDKAMKAVVLGEELEFFISEEVKANPHTLSPQEKAHPWTAPRWDYMPTGRLKLSINCRLDARIRHSWSDGKRRCIEKCLGHFLVTLPLIAQTLKIEREEHTRRQREWEEQRKREEEARRRREEYNRKAKVMEELARGWHEAGRLREYAEAIKAATENPDTPEEQKPDLAAMADFALRHANYLDPITDLKWMVTQFNPPWQYA